MLYILNFDSVSREFCLVHCIVLFEMIYERRYPFCDSGLLSFGAHNLLRALLESMLWVFKKPSFGSVYKVLDCIPT